jgi:hypothetical protein
VSSVVARFVPPFVPSRFPFESRNIAWDVVVSPPMQTQIRPVAFTVARSAAMVAIAILLILVLLPAAIAAQAAVAV